MSEQKQNYYGRLCTELYEILHEKAPQDELDFYLSYAEKGQKILEPLCGSGRFLVPFMERGFDIDGMDSSIEMLEKLKQKAPDAKIIHADCNAPRLSRAALRRSSQKMRISFSDRLLRRPILSYAAEALNHLSYS